MHHCALLSNVKLKPKIFFFQNYQVVINATSQWCVFNNYSLDKHRHQIWHHFYFSFEYWNNRLALNIATICHKNLKNALLVRFCLTIFISNFLVPFWKKSLFILVKNISKVCSYSKISRATFLLQWPFLTSKVLKEYFDICLFFLMNKNLLCFPKSTSWIFLLRPWPLQ